MIKVAFNCEDEGKGHMVFKILKKKKNQRI